MHRDIIVVGGSVPGHDYFLSILAHKKIVTGFNKRHR